MEFLKQKLQCLYRNHKILNWEIEHTRRTRINETLECACALENQRERNHLAQMVQEGKKCSPCFEVVHQLSLLLKQLL